jgi:predicted nucleic acid-binding protein
MIHLDTNLLIDLVTVGCPRIDLIRAWLRDGETLAVSAIAWSEFCNGPHSRAQKDAVFAILGRQVHPFDAAQAEQASRLFHYTGRRRGSHADCMIAAAAMSQEAPIATRNIKDFQRFEAYGLKLNPIPTE